MVGMCIECVLNVRGCSIVNGIEHTCVTVYIRNTLLQLASRFKLQYALVKFHRINKLIKRITESKVQKKGNMRAGLESKSAADSSLGPCLQPQLTRPPPNRLSKRGNHNRALRVQGIHSGTSGRRDRQLQICHHRLRHRGADRMVLTHQRRRRS